MPRIVGVDIPGNKPLEIALTYIHGIGRSSGNKIAREAGVEPGTKADELTEDQFSRIVNIIDRSYVVEGELRRMVAQNIARLREINCYRGIRHRKGLPVRGQRTRTNARTRKGPKKTVAVKRGVKELG
ncbi:MAG: 30S ribosomal protein S13 [Planctomycetota bacterium]